MRKLQTSDPQQQFAKKLSGRNDLQIFKKKNPWRHFPKDIYHEYSCIRVVYFVLQHHLTHTDHLLACVWDFWINFKDTTVIVFTLHLNVIYSKCENLLKRYLETCITLNTLNTLNGARGIIFLIGKCIKSVYQWATLTHDHCRGDQLVSTLASHSCYNKVFFVVVKIDVRAKLLLGLMGLW